MKYIVLVVLLVQLVCLVKAVDTEWMPPAATQFIPAVGTNDEKIAQYEDKLTELKLLQERGTATATALQQQIQNLSAQHAALQSQPAPVNNFSFRETVSMADGQAQDSSSLTNSLMESGAEVQSGPPGAPVSPKMKKLAAAMKAVKEDIMSKLREAKRESAWVNDVQRIVTQYNKKVRNVKKNLKKIRGDIRSLIEKKRQIRNAQIQAQLQDRLRDASGDLEMITGKLNSINAQAKAFNKNKNAIADTISKINNELKKLKGAPKTSAKKDDKKGKGKGKGKAAKK